MRTGYSAPGTPSRHCPHRRRFRRIAASSHPPPRSAALPLAWHPPPESSYPASSPAYPALVSRSSCPPCALLPRHHRQCVRHADRKHHQRNHDPTIEHEDPPKLRETIEEDEVGECEVIVQVRGQDPHDPRSEEAGEDRHRKAPATDVLGKFRKCGIGGQRD